MSALFALVPLPYRWLALAALVAVVWGHGYLMGSEDGEDALNALQAAVDKQTGELVAKQGERQRAAAVATQEKDAHHAEDLKEIDDWWAAYADGLRLGAGGRPAGEPVRGPTEICGDPARDIELSLALATARADLRERDFAYREGVGRLLAACEVQTADLVDLQQTWAHRTLINQP